MKGINAFGKRIDKNILLGFYKLFKNSPKRIFVKSDFGASNLAIPNYLNLLIRLGIIERMDTRYLMGRYKHLRQCKGYRLRKEQIEKELAGGEE